MLSCLALRRRQSRSLKDNRTCTYIVGRHDTRTNKVLLTNCDFVVRVSESGICQEEPQFEFESDP
jgi:hypothetical protein